MEVTSLTPGCRQPEGNKVIYPEQREAGPFTRDCKKGRDSGWEDCIKHPWSKFSGSLLHLSEPPNVWEPARVLILSHSFTTSCICNDSFGAKLSSLLRTIPLGAEVGAGRVGLPLSLIDISEFFFFSRLGV